MMAPPAKSGSTDHTRNTQTIDTATIVPMPPATIKLCAKTSAARTVHFVRRWRVRPVKLVDTERVQGSGFRVRGLVLAAQCAFDDARKHPVIEITHVAKSVGVPRESQNAKYKSKNANRCWCMPRADFPGFDFCILHFDLPRRRATPGARKSMATVKWQNALWSTRGNGCGARAV